MIGSVGLGDPLLELGQSNRAAPQIAVLLRPRGNDAEAAAGAGRHMAAARAVDHRWVHLVLGPVAIDRRPGGPGDHRSATPLHGPPDQPVDQRVLERGESGLSGGGEGDEPAGIVAARVRYRQQHGQLAARRLDDGGRKRRHGKYLCQFKTSLRPCNA